MPHAEDAEIGHENGILGKYIEKGVESIARYLLGNPEHCQSAKTERHGESCSIDKPIYVEPGKRYAFILSGKPECRHRENVSKAYLTLLDCDFPEENILVLDGNGEQTYGGCEVEYPYPIHGAATKENIEKVFEILSERICDEDLLAIYVTDHGERRLGLDCSSGSCKIAKVSTIILQEEKLRETEFERYLSAIKPMAGVLIFDQCNSGAFATRGGNGNYIGLSACKDDEPSHSNTFPQAFFAAWNDAKADLNEDGYISIKEAFLYALENDANARLGKQHPQIVSEIDPDKVFVNGGSRRGI